MNSDFKNDRVTDPTQITEKQEKNVKKYVKDYFDKAVAKKKEHDKRRAERKAKEGGPTASPGNLEVGHESKKDESDIDEVMEASDDEETKREPSSITPITPLDQTVNGEGLKRKREVELNEDGVKLEEEEATPSKRARSVTPPEPPPPPPPPPAEDELMFEGRQPLDVWPTDEGGMFNEEASDGTDQPVSPLRPPGGALGASPRNEAAFTQNQKVTIGAAMSPSGHDNIGFAQEMGPAGMSGGRLSYMETQSS